MALGGAGLLLASGPLQAQTDNYPNRPVRLVVPYPPGGQVDVLARMIAKELGDSIGQAVVIDNKPGGSTIIGADAVAKSAPDGYSLLFTTTTSSAANKSAFKTLPYDPVKDFAHVSRLFASSFVLVARSDFPASNLREFLAHVRNRKPPMSVAHWSSGSQIAAASLKTLGKLDLLAVPYKGSPLAVTDLLGGQVDMTFTDFTTALPHIRSGRLKGIGVTSQRRSSLAPEIPPIADEVPGFVVTTWGGIIAPAGTPAPIVNKLNGALMVVMGKAEVKSKLADAGIEAFPSASPAEFARYVESEIENWRRLQADAGIQPQ